MNQPPYRGPIKATFYEGGFLPCRQDSCVENLWWMIDNFPKATSLSC